MANDEVQVSVRLKGELAAAFLRWVADEHRSRAGGAKYIIDQFLTAVATDSTTPQVHEEVPAHV